MIILYHPRATRPRNRRLPLAVLALAAVLEGREEYEIVDGNLEENPTARILELIDRHKVELLGVSAMPGPQMVAAMETSREVRRLHPQVPICWGGYFPSIYPDAALNARYVDFVARGQGEDTLLELLDALRGKRPLDSVKGLSYKDMFGLRRDNGERPMKGPDEFPWSPFHRLPVEKYLRPSFFGKRTAVHHASIGCPFNCSFCGVHAAYGNKEKMESPERTVAILTHLVERYGADSVQFYDMNFFLREDHARELCDRMAHLNLRWWCEARVDIMSRYSDETFAAIKRAGCAMIFFGAESGSDWVLEEMQKGITTQQTLEMARRTRQFGIIPEFSFVIGNPNDPDRDTRETLRFIRQIKRHQPRFGDHHPALHSDTSAARCRRRDVRQDRCSVSGFAGRVGGKGVDELHSAHRYQRSVAQAPDQEAHRQLRDRRRFTLAHGSGYSRSALEPRTSANSQRVALCLAHL